jgi:diadenosine tetraphosphate (Ap4A) HIT family hydrolase
MPAASEPFFQRLKALFKPGRKTAWDRVVRYALLFGVSYPLILLGVALNGRVLLSSVKGLGDAAFAVALVIVTIWYGGIITDFYSKLTGFGITDIRVNRRGQDPELTAVWMERIRDSREITIVGTLSRGWFIVTYEHLDVLLKEQSDLVKFDVFLLDPFGKIWRAMVESGYPHDVFLDEAIAVFRSVHDLARDHEKVHVYLYDTDPMSCVIARGAIYLGLYLPRTSKRQIPEFTISVGSFLGDKIGESVRQLRNSAPRVNPKTIETYRNLMKSHSAAPREEFWNDPLVYCDFCKEWKDLPSTFERRYVGFQESRIIPVGEDFYIMPSLGPLVPDHALLVPRVHVTSSARLESHAFSQLVSIAEKWSKKTAEKKMLPLIFEHGTPSEDTAHGGCGICHCHLHLLALEPEKSHDFYDRLQEFLREKKYEIRVSDLASWNNVKEFANEAYIGVRLGTENPKVFRFGHGVQLESQLMRKFLASKVITGGVNWDWRVDDGKLSNGANQQLKESIGNLTATVQ